MSVDKLIDLLVMCIQWLLPFEVIDAYQKGVVLRFGVEHRDLEPGFHWIWPLGIERVLLDNVVQRTTNLKAQSLVTKDGKSVVISAVVTSRIHSIRKALIDCESVHNVLEDSCYGQIATLVVAATWDEIRAEPFGETLTAACRKQAFKFGVEIMRVQLSDISLSRAIRLYQASA